MSILVSTNPGERPGWNTIATLAIVAWATVPVLAPHNAHARIGRCTTGSLSPTEESLLLATAGRILPPYAELTVSNLCGSMLAEITTQKIPDQPGGSHWWVADCRRDGLEWVCDRIQFREVDKRLTIGGRPMQVAMTFDEGTVPEAVEPVATRALRLYADPDSQLPLCGGIKDRENRWSTLRKEHPLQGNNIRVHVIAPQYVNTGSILLDEVVQPDDFKIHIQLPIVGPDKQDPRPHPEAPVGRKCGLSGTSSVAVECRTIQSEPTAAEPPCWMPMAY